MWGVPSAKANAARAMPCPAPLNHSCADDSAAIPPVKLMMGGWGMRNYYGIYLFPNKKAIAIRAMATN